MSSLLLAKIHHIEELEGAFRSSMTYAMHLSWLQQLFTDLD